MKFLSLDGLREFLNSIKDIFAPIIHSHSLSEISDLMIDDEVGNTSNLVKNSAINSAINTVKNELSKNIEDAIVTKADTETVLYKTPQELTDAERQIVLTNLGLNSSAPEEPPVSAYPITTEYEYTYDGDNTSDNNAWITNYGGTKVFVKMGEIPDGELNLEGAILFRTNPNNEWLNRSITISADHLTEVVNKAGEDISAAQSGLIQIFDQHNSDFSKMTVLCICTIPGWYNVTFDDWFEIINFPETGIYGYDKRTYGGNDYLQSFKFSATVTPSTGNNGSVGGGTNTNPISPVHYIGNEISIFSRGICIGDSVTDGSFDSGDGGTVIRKFSYPSILKRITNIEIANAGIAGATSGSWYDASINSDTLWGK